MADYLQLARERAAGAPPADEANPYLPIAREDQNLRISRSRFLIEQALKDNPDLVAERQRLSQTSGLPLSVIERNYDEVKRKEAAAAIDLARMAEDSPVLARQLIDPTFTSVAVDDLTTLQTIGQIAKDLGGTMKAATFGASRGVAGTVRAGFELAAPALDVLEPVTEIGGNPLRRLAEGFGMVGEAAGRTAKAAMPGTEGILASGFYSGVRSLTQNLMTLPLAFLPGGAPAALTGMTVFTGGEAYQDAREKGLPMSQALPFAASQAAIEYATEKLPLGALLKDVKVGAGFLQILGRQIALEVPGEQIATVLQDLNEWAILNPGKPFSDYVAERPSAAAQTLIATIVGTGGNVAVVKGIETAISRLASDGANMQRAGITAQALEQALRAAEISKLRARSPEQFRSLMSQMAEDGSIYVDAQVLNQMPPELLQRMEGVVDALPEALLANAPVAVKLADVLTLAPGTPQAEVFMQNARSAPDAPSLVEAKEAGKRAQEFLQQEAERVIQQAQDQEAMRASAEAVRTSILGELNAAGRYRPQVNEAMSQWASAFYTTMASRVGMTPEEFYQRYRLRVLGQAPAGQGPVIEQMPPPEGFDTQVVGADGKPLRMYHGTKEEIEGAFRAERGMIGTGVYFTSEPDEATEFATNATWNIRPNVVPAYIQIRNPYYVSSKWDKVPKDAAEQGYDGVILRRPDGSVQWAIPFTSQQIVSSINGEVFNQAARVRPMPPQIAAAADVGNARTIAASQKWPTNRDFKLAIQNAVRAVMGQRDLREDTPTNRAYITQQLLKEAREALITNSNAIGWYDEKVTTALEVVSTIHPELKTDEQSKFAFIWALAVTSNGIKVDKNFELAERSYRIWKESDADPAKRRLPASNIGVGPTASKIHDGLRAYNTLIERWGFDRLRSFATTLQPNRDVVAAYGRKVSGEGMDTQVYGAGILGPKIGNGFFMNLYGEFGQLTMDRWWVRMWGRITGDLVEINPAATREARASFVSLIDLIKADRQALRAVEQAIGAKLNKGTPVETAKAIIKASADEDVRNALKAVLPATPEREAAAKEIRGKLKDFVSIGDELRKAAKSFYGYLDGQIEVPGGSKRRDMMREVSQAVLAELQKDNPSLTMADFQALMWYPEKTLYDSAGAQEQDSEGYDDDEAPDYANAAIKLARDQGVSDADINSAVERARSDIEARQRAGRSGRGVVGVPEQGGDGAGADTGAAQVLTQGGLDERDQQAGDGRGRYSGGGLAALEGAPNVAGASGPDPRIVAVAEQYALDNGIPLRRQGQYAKVDPERGARIAAAYDAMQHSPQDPAVREAYENLARQTRAQYDALIAAGYEFTFFDSASDPYQGNPWNAMRDLRANQRMAVYGTYDGFGTEGISQVSVDNNPMLADTGLQWPDQAGVMHSVVMNDLFRAVHDAFGHGLEGAGFRQQGEENAWQAHVRLFTGSARGAITSETRGQNSWLNFGPYGEANQTAKVEDTVFADQKTGLMPEWTWTEGVVDDMPAPPLAQGPRGTFNPRTLELVLSPTADLSTFFHETGHFFLEVMADVASQPGAPAMIVEDMNKVLAWFGVPDLATWNAMDLEQQRPYHERWAESIEQYLMEGKAPSVELQPLMRRFRAWLLNVYQSIKQFVAGRPAAEQQPLNDDIRRVMDRMLATDEQIAQANEVAGLVPDEQADGEAAERLQKRSMADLKWAVKARDKVIKALQKQAKEIERSVRMEVTAEVNAMPEVLAAEAIRKAEKDYEGDPVSADMNIATIADAYGYPSVDAMYQAIEAFGDKREAIDGLTERRLLENYGELIDERSIIEAANEAVHNEARARSLATELRTQQEMLGQRRDTGETNARGARVTVNVLVEAAKQFGANVVARTPLKDLRATAWKHTAAERRAGKRWAEATAAGNTADAVKAKQDQVLNNAAAKAALDAADRAKKTLEFFARVTKGNDEKTVEKGRDPDIVNAARAVLAAYGIQTPASKNAAAYLETVKRNDPDTWNAIEPMIAAATQNAQPLEALTFEELQGLEESIRAMWFMAKRSRQMEVDGNLLDIDDVAQELYLRMEEIGIPDRVPGEGMAVTKEEERGLFLKQGVAFLRRVEQWAEGMDGKYGGPFLRYVFQPIKAAADAYRKDRIAYRKRFQALVDNLAPIVGDSVIAAPELGYTFGTPGSTAGTAMNEVLHAIAHTGNDSNKRKLLLGRGWATENPDGTLDTRRWDAFIARLVAEGKLTQGHYDFVQGVWDLLEDTKPLAQKAHRDAFGRYFSEVTANEFVDPFGVTRRGGYVPAQVDTRLVKDNVLRKMAEEQNNSMAYSFPQPAKGFTMARTEYNQPLMLDLRSLSQHLDKVLLFGHMTNPARDVRKLITRKTVSQPLDRIQPATIESMLQPWLQRSAQQIVETPIVGSGRWARVPGIIRARAGMALMFANVSNAIQQVTGLANAAVRVKPSYLMRSMAQYVANPREFSRAVWGASPYMDDRAKNEVAVLNEQMQAILIKPTTYETVKDWSSRHAYFLQTALDNVLSPIVWTGAFNQGLAQGMSDVEAVRFADSTVRQTQGSTLPEDVSRIETGPAYARAFTQFVGYFNMMANTNATALKQIVGEVGLKKGAGKALYVVMMGLMVPIWIAEAIALAMRGGPEDEDDDGYLDDWLAEVFGMGTAKGLLAQVPIIGQFGVASFNRFNDNPLDDRVSLSPAVSLLESAVGAPQSVYKAIVEEGSAQKAIRDVATLVSVATGVPLYGVARPIGYAAGVAQGRIEPEGPVDVVRGLVTGTASPESKQR